MSLKHKVASLLLLSLVACPDSSHAPATLNASDAVATASLTRSVSTTDAVRVGNDVTTFSASATGAGQPLSGRTPPTKTQTRASSGSTSGAATVTAQLKRDSTNIGTTMQAITTAAGPFNIPVRFVDTLPDTSNHTYTCAVTAGAGTIATAASGIEISASEM
jgi:hypothetical protein